MKPIKRVSAKKYKGLGDIVATVAEPIATVLDQTLGTRIKGCASCAKRRQWLNRVGIGALPEP